LDAVDLRGAQHLGSTMGAHYRHTTPEMATRVVMAIQDRLVVDVSVAEQVVEAQPTRVPRKFSDDYGPHSLANGGSGHSNHAAGQVLDPA
jgi:hypothetical protein